MPDIEPVRIQLSRRAGFRLGPNARSVARPGLFGNPWIVGTPGRLAIQSWQEPFEARLELPFSHGLTADRAVSAYRAWLTCDRRFVLTDFVLSDTALEGVPYAITLAARVVLLRYRARVLEALPRLRGCDLACWCKPGAPCHADVLLDLANRPEAGRREAPTGKKEFHRDAGT